MYPLVKKRSVSLTAEKQSGEKKRKIMLDSDVCKKTIHDDFTHFKYYIIFCSRFQKTFRQKYGDTYLAIWICKI
jgi:hypothetical protein